MHGYVLNDFGRDEREWVDDLCDACALHADLLAKGDDSAFQSKVHLRMEGRGWGEVKTLKEKAVRKD